MSCTAHILALRVFKINERLCTCDLARNGGTAERPCFELRTCASFIPTQRTETLGDFDVPVRPWQFLGVDLCQFEGRNCLITVDYFSESDYLEKQHQ